MKIGIIGTGRMGSARIDCLAKNKQADLVWICSRTKERAGEFLEEKRPAGSGGRIELFGNVSEALQEGGAEAVFVTSPNALHREIAGMAFDAGLHVFLEYPPAITPADGTELIDLAAKAGRVYAVGLTHLRGGRHRAIAERCAGKTELGKPRVYQMIFCSGSPISRWYDRPEISGGMFVSSLYHYLDETLDFLGEPDAVAATYVAEHARDNCIVSDTGCVQLRFPSGCTAQISYARGMKQPGIGGRRTIIFEAGYIVEDARGIRVLTPDGDVDLAYEDIDAMQVETDEFMDMAQVGGGVHETVYHAQRTLEVADLARRQIV